MIVLGVNDQFYIDQAGTHLTPVANANGDDHAASWMQPSPTAFEISSGGLKPVSTLPSGSQLQAQPRHVAGDQDDRADKDPMLLSSLQQRL